MKRIFYAFAAFLFIISACKKNNVSDVGKQLLIGTWNQVDISTKVPTGKYLKFSESGNLETTVISGYNSYEVNSGRLIFKGSSGTLVHSFTVGSDSLYIQPDVICQDPNGCGQLFARQK
ncbi:hypothetical protein [Mucilaginibacter auburnensis]|uniref:Lipocalin-like protein n=1 Tax=Mucilaginibacter auburnensis TaxID=1457233 RepID=A0A2H9VNG7_9SPHI|nr:hypothetical protein [Mucilaginibacter auburnensis]PJJ79875.1 hypothetical protein CLV57_3014 [Mucilaginibacter auburnensis]